MKNILWALFFIVYFKGGSGKFIGFKENIKTHEADVVLEIKGKNVIITSDKVKYIQEVKE